MDNLKSSKDVDLRQILNANRASTFVSIADQAANLSSSKFDDESDREEERNLVIEMPSEDDIQKDKDESKDKSIGTALKQISMESEQIIEERNQTPKQGTCRIGF